MKNKAKKISFLPRWRRKLKIALKQKKSSYNPKTGNKKNNKAGNSKIHNNPEIKIHFDLKPSGFCPVQAEGTINGIPFYFRSRGTQWALYLATETNSDPLDDSSKVFQEDYPNAKNAFSAGYATQKECIAFIKKAAKFIIQEPNL